MKEVLFDILFSKEKQKGEKEEKEKEEKEKDKVKEIVINGGKNLMHQKR